MPLLCQGDATFLPFKNEPVAFLTPVDLQMATGMRQRTMYGRISGQFVERQTDRLD